jgi:hypothetical protein
VSHPGIVIHHKRYQRMVSVSSIMGVAEMADRSTHDPKGIGDKSIIIGTAL